VSLFASTIPSNDGYVAAAYIFFFALILVYVAIMAMRLARVESKLKQTHEHREDEEPMAVGGSEPLEREAV
jgi:hypothetical protein